MDATPGNLGAPPPPPPPPTAPPPPPPTTPPSGKASENRQVMLVLSYLGILALIPLLVEKEDREVQWHAKHGLVLLAAEVVLAIAFGIFTTILSVATHGMFGCIGCGVWTVLPLGILILHILCIVKALNGERLTIPGLSELADKF